MAGVSSFILLKSELVACALLSSIFFMASVSGFLCDWFCSLIVVLSIHMDDQIDGRTLIGSYVCTEKPGEFRWQPGSLTQVCKPFSYIFFSPYTYSLTSASPYSGCFFGVLGCLWGYRQSTIWCAFHHITLAGWCTLLCNRAWTGYSAYFDMLPFLYCQLHSKTDTLLLSNSNRYHYWAFVHGS